MTKQEQNKRDKETQITKAWNTYDNGNITDAKAIVKRYSLKIWDLFKWRKEEVFTGSQFRLDRLVKECELLKAK